VAIWFAPEEFTADERALLRAYFTNLDEPVFAWSTCPR